MKNKLGIILVAILALAFFLPGHAADRVVRTHSFDLAGITEVNINNSVGELEIVLVEGNELRVEIEIEGEDQGIFRGKRDVDDIELEVIERGSRLTLSLDEDDITAHWVVELPEVSDIGIDMGVGSVRVEIGDSNLDVDLGVGEVRVDAPLALAGRISGEVGVGDVNVRGASSVDERRAFVSADTEARGEGENRIDIHVGVGEVRVDLH